MDMGLLATFEEVARQGSVTAAADRLGYTQSAVSRQIATLEEDFGARLFDRTTRGVVLTVHGRCLLPHARAVRERLHEAHRELQALGSLEHGRLRIAAFPTAVAALVPRAIAAFAGAHPGVELSLVEGTSGRLMAQVQSGDADVAVISAFADQRVDGRQFERTHLLDDRMLVALPSAHRLAGRRTVRLADLASENWIGADDDWILGPRSLHPDFEPRVDFEVREWTAKLGMVAAGLGITIVPGLAAEAVRADVALVSLRRQDAPLRDIYAVLPADRTPPPAAKAFVRALTSAARGRSAAADAVPAPSSRRC